MSWDIDEGDIKGDPFSRTIDDALVGSLALSILREH